MGTLFVRPGFRGFARPRALDVADVAASVAKFEGDPRGVYYVGGDYGRRKVSGRSRSLATVVEVSTFVPLSEFVRRAAEAARDEGGFDAALAVGGLSLHSGAKPAVYLYLYRDPEGNLRAVRDIPTPGGAFAGRSFKAGEVVVPAAPVEAPAPVEAEAVEPKAAKPRRKNA